MDYEGEKFVNIGVFVGSDGNRYLLLINTELPLKRRQQIILKANSGVLPVKEHIGRVRLPLEDIMRVSNSAEILKTFLEIGTVGGEKVIDL